MEIVVACNVQYMQGIIKFLHLLRLCDCRLRARMRACVEKYDIVALLPLSFISLSYASG